MKKLSIFLSLSCLLFSATAQAAATDHGGQKPKSVIRARGLNPQILDLALKAYTKASQEGLTQTSLLTVVDYSKPSTEPRLWVIDLKNQKTLFRELVAHGRDKEGKETRQAALFSNRPGSHASSLGVYVTANAYKGKHGLSLKLRGLEKEFNSNAEKRAIVMHPASYVSRQVIRNKGRLGSSYGCFSLRPAVASKVINRIKNGSVIFAYYPDPTWLKRSAFLNQ